MQLAMLIRGCAHNVHAPAASTVWRASLVVAGLTLRRYGYYSKDVK